MELVLRQLFSKFNTKIEEQFAFSNEVKLKFSVCQKF